jgi:hypothetical protein
MQMQAVVAGDQREPEAAAFPEHDLADACDLHGRKLNGRDELRKALSMCATLAVPIAAKGSEARLKASWSAVTTLQYLTSSTQLGVRAAV